jgi:hypothetical protein
MVAYTIRTVDPDAFRVRNYPFELEPYQPYSFEPVSFFDNEGNKPAAGYVWVGEDKYYVVHPHENGFVVKKIYAEDTNETDPVLRAWGVYDHLNLWDMPDSRFQKWLEKQILNLLGSENHLTCKIRYRLTAFGPRRSEKFHPKISVWQSLENRDNDRVTAMKPARALALMFPELDHKSIIHINDEYLQEFAPREFTIHVSKEAKHFKDAYAGEQSPNENIDTTPHRKHLAHSCMRYNFDNLPMHPAEAYASGDFTIVYALDQNDLVAGRCVVYTAEQQPQAGPVYGVSEQALDCIQERLEAMGADMTGCASWKGAKLRRVEYDGGFIGPYLDLTPQSLDDMGDYLIVASRGEIDASQYNGVLGGHHTQCCQCNERLSEDDYWYSEHTSEHYCESCYYDEHVYCDYWQETVHVDQTIVCYRLAYGGQRESVQVYDHIVHNDDTFIMCTDDEYWHQDDVVYCECDDTWISPDDIDDYFTSDWDCELYPNEVMCRLTDGDVVSKYELDAHPGIWQKNKDYEWEEVQEELELDV